MATYLKRRLSAAETDAADAKVRETVEGIIVAIKARGDAMVKLGGTLTASGGAVLSAGGKLGVKGTACGVLMTAASATALSNAGAAVNAGTEISWTRM